MRRFLFIGFVMLLNFCFGLSAFGMTKIRVGYIVDVNTAPIFVALEKGFFKEGGLDVEVKEYISGDDSYTALKGGVMDIHQNMGANAVAKFHSQGIGIYMTKVWSLPHFKVLTQKEAAYKTLADLKGKKYAVTSFAGTTFAISTMAFNAIGIDVKKELEVKTMPPAIMQVELERGGIEAGILWEPLVYKALKPGKLRVLIDPADIYVEKFKKRFFHGATGCMKDFFDKNREVMKKYNQAIDKAIQFTLTNKEEANKIIAARWKGYTPEEVGKIRESWGDGWIKGEIDSQQIEEMQFMFDKMLELTDYFKTRAIAAEVMKRP